MFTRVHNRLQLSIKTRTRHAASGDSEIAFEIHAACPREEHVLNCKSVNPGVMVCTFSNLMAFGNSEGCTKTRTRYPDSGMMLLECKGR